MARGCSLQVCEQSDIDPNPSHVYVGGVWYEPNPAPCLLCAPPVSPGHTIGRVRHGDAHIGVSINNVVNLGNSQSQPIFLLLVVLSDPTPCHDFSLVVV